MVCVSLVPPGTLKPPPAHRPKSQGWPSSGLEDWAVARDELVTSRKTKNPPRRRRDAENSNRQMTVESMKISWEYEREYQVEGRRVKWAISNE
jgi:hypothetical protein